MHRGYEAELGLVCQDGPFYRLGSLMAYDDKGQVRAQEVKMPPKVAAGEWLVGRYGAGRPAVVP